MTKPSWLTIRLSKAERSDLRRCERIIKRGSKVFIQVSEALMEIRDKRLYRENYNTFEQYCQDKWGFTARHGQRLLAAKEVADNLRPIGRIPDNESQARPLVGLPAETQREVWQEAVEAADDGKITAERVAEIAEPHKVEPPAPAPEPTPEPPAPVDWAAVLVPLSFYLTHSQKRIVYTTPYFSHWEAARVKEKGMVPQRGAYIIKSDAFKDYRFEKLARANDSPPLTAGDTPSNEAQALHPAALDDSQSPDEPTKPTLTIQPDKWYPVKHTENAIYCDPFDSQKDGAADPRYQGHAIQQGKIILAGIDSRTVYASYRIIKPQDEPTAPRHDPRQVSNAGEWTPGDKAYLNRAQAVVNHAHPGKMPYAGKSAAVDELERLHARVLELEAENEALRSENTRLKAENYALRNMKVQPSDVIGKPAERIHQ